MTVTRILLLAAIPLVSLASPASAADRKETPPAAFQAVLDCKSIADSSARLACYDKAVVAMELASTNKDLVVVDRAAMRETRRGLFGITLPKIKLFGDGDNEADDVKQIETTISSVSRGENGYLFTLDDGALWTQTDGIYIPQPKSGMTIRIRRASLGSYFANVNGSVAIRVKRLNN